MVLKMIALQLQFYQCKYSMVIDRELEGIILKALEVTKILNMNEIFSKTLFVHDWILAAICALGAKRNESTTADNRYLLIGQSKKGFLVEIVR